jgi:Na+/glutamate symporter
MSRLMLVVMLITPWIAYIVGAIRFEGGFTLVGALFALALNCTAMYFYTDRDLW